MARGEVGRDSRNRHVKSTLESIASINALRAQACELRNPLRRNGPSVHEAREVADQLDAQAEEQSEALYWGLAQRIRLATSPSHSTLSAGLLGAGV